jgi:hypothetical protein
MNALLPHTRADDTLLRGHQELIDLCELRGAQAIKGEVSALLEHLSLSVIGTLDVAIELCAGVS